MIATTEAMKRPYPDKKVVNTAALAMIFQGQIAKARNSTRSWPRGMVIYLGKSIEQSEPKGIMFAAILVPKMETVQQAAHRKQANREPGVQYLVIMASIRSHWFHSSRSHALLMAAVDKIPSDADRVTAIGLEMS
jgi:hypothetical protein